MTTASLSSTSTYPTQRSSSSPPAPASVYPPSRKCTSYHCSVTGRSRSRGSTPSTCGLRGATKSIASPTTIHCSSLFVSRTSTACSTNSRTPPRSTPTARPSPLYRHAATATDFFARSWNGSGKIPFTLDGMKACQVQRME